MKVKLYQRALHDCETYINECSSDWTSNKERADFIDLIKRHATSIKTLYQQMKKNGKSSELLKQIDLFERALLKMYFIFTGKSKQKSQHGTKRLYDILTHTRNEMLQGEIEYPRPEESEDSESFCSRVSNDVKEYYIRKNMYEKNSHFGIPIFKMVVESTCFGHEEDRNKTTKEMQDRARRIKLLREHQPSSAALQDMAAIDEQQLLLETYINHKVKVYAMQDSILRDVIDETKNEILLSGKVRHPTLPSRVLDTYQADFVRKFKASCERFYRKALSNHETPETNIFLEGATLSLSAISESSDHAALKDLNGVVQGLYGIYKKSQQDAIKKVVSFLRSQDPDDLSELSDLIARHIVLRHGEVIKSLSTNARNFYAESLAFVGMHHMVHNDHLQHIDLKSPESFMRCFRSMLDGIQNKLISKPKKKVPRKISKKEFENSLICLVDKETHKQHWYKPKDSDSIDVLKVKVEGPFGFDEFDTTEHEPVDIKQKYYAENIWVRVFVEVELNKTSAPQYAPGKFHNPRVTLKNETKEQIRTLFASDLFDFLGKEANAQLVLVGTDGDTARSEFCSAIATFISNSDIIRPSNRHPNQLKLNIPESSFIAKEKRRKWEAGVKKKFAEMLSSQQSLQLTV